MVFKLISYILYISNQILIFLLLDEDMHEHLSNYYVRKRIGNSSQNHDEGNETKEDAVCNNMRHDFLQHGTKPDPYDTGTVSAVKTMSPSISIKIWVYTTRSVKHTVITSLCMG